MREAIATSAERGRELEQLEHRMGQHDEEITSLFEAIKQLMALPTRGKGRIGF